VLLMTAMTTLFLAGLSTRKQASPLSTGWP
jgi:hypothetical protein